MDLEEQNGREFEERRESEVESNIGGIEVIGMVTGGLVEGGKTRDDRRDRGDRGRYGLYLH